MNDNSSSFETINPKEITRLILYDKYDLEIHLSYYTPDVMTREAVRKMKQRFYFDESSNQIGRLTDYEDEFDLLPQDTVDRHGNRVAAKICCNEQGDKSHLHYQRGNPFNLYGLAHGYTIDGEGVIFESAKMCDYDYIYNDDKQHAAFVQAYEFYHTSRMLKKAARHLDDLKMKDCARTLASRLLLGMGLN